MTPCKLDEVTVLSKILPAIFFFACLSEKVCDFVDGGQNMTLSCSIQNLVTLHDTLNFKAKKCEFKIGEEVSAGS